MAKRAYIAVLVLVTSFLLVTSNATANVSTAKDRFVPPGGWGALDFQIAHEYWGTDHSPLCATEAVYFDGVTGPTGAAGLATEPTEPGTECVMHIVQGQGVIRQCDTIVHEFGHWLGRGHSPDPSNVMYAYQVASAVPGRCWRTLKLLHPHVTVAEERISFDNSEPISFARPAG